MVEIASPFCYQISSVYVAQQVVYGTVYDMYNKKVTLPLGLCLKPLTLVVI